MIFWKIKTALQGVHTLMNFSNAQVGAMINQNVENPLDPNPRVASTEGINETGACCSITIGVIEGFHDAEMEFVDETRFLILAKLAL